MAPYLAETQFAGKVHDSTLGNPHWLLKYPNEGKNLSMEVCHFRSWRKLMEWLRLYHSGYFMRMPRFVEGEDRRLFVVCSRLFDMAKELKGMPWKLAENVLDMARAAMYTAYPHPAFSPTS